MLEIDSPKKVVFFGISRFHESTDTVTFNRKAGHNDVVEVEYTSDIELVKWYRYVFLELTQVHGTPYRSSACYVLVKIMCT